MKSEKVEYNELIAIRSPPGDRWRLVDDQEEKIHEGLTNALEAYFHKSKFKGSYKLDPLDGKLYSINSQEVEVEEAKLYAAKGTALEARCLRNMVRDLVPSLIFRIFMG